VQFEEGNRSVQVRADGDEQRASGLVDTHAHLQWPTLAAEADAVVARARDAGVARILTLGTDPTSSEAAIGLAERYRDDGVYAAVGLHPGDVPANADEAREALARIAALLEHPRVAAVGETGLDYYHADGPPREAQRASFERHLELAEATRKPICIHNRESTDDVMRLLARYAGRVTPVLHCYTGDLATALQAVDLGCYISFAGNSTYPKLRALLDVAAEVPAERLLLETDAPFLAPRPLRGRRNEPAHVVHTYDAVAAARGVTRDALGRLVTDNAARLFGWPRENGGRRPDDKNESAA